MFIDRKWCRVGNVGNKFIYAFTQERDLVLVARSYSGMEAVKQGDILSFVPRDPIGQCPEGRQKAKWLADSPKLIGQRPADYKYNRADDPNPCAWKKRTESGNEWKDFVSTVAPDR